MTCPPLCPDGNPHRRLVTGQGYAMVGVCKKCGDKQNYAFTLEETTFTRWQFRKDRKEPAVSSYGGTV